MKRLLGLGAGLLFLSTALTGCSSSNEAPLAPFPSPEETHVAVTQSERDVSFDMFSGTPGYVIESDTTGYLILGGSGSCPPVIDTATLAMDDLVVELEGFPLGRACTEDFTLYTFDYAVTNGVVSETTTVRLVDGDKEQLFTNLTPAI